MTQGRASIIQSLTNYSWTLVMFNVLIFYLAIVPTGEHRSPSERLSDHARAIHTVVRQTSKTADRADPADAVPRDMQGLLVAIVHPPTTSQRPSELIAIAAERPASDMQSKIAAAIGGAAFAPAPRSGITSIDHASGAAGRPPI